MTWIVINSINGQYGTILHHTKQCMMSFRWLSKGVQTELIQAERAPDTPELKDCLAMEAPSLPKVSLQGLTAAL